MNSAERDPCPSCGFSDTAFIVAALNRLTNAVYYLAAEHRASRLDTTINLALYDVMRHSREAGE